MSDPDRLLDQPASPLTRELLSAARSDEPSEALLGRTLMAIGAATSLVASAGTSAAAAGATGAMGAAAASAKGSSFLLLLKWLSIGALGGAVTAMGAHEARDALRALSAPSEEVTSLPKALDAERFASVRSELPPRPAERSDPSLIEDSLPPPPRPPPSAAAPSGSSLAAEVAALDAARQALARGDTSRALSLLDAHRDRFPEAHLLPEALHIRMEALYARGERPAAARIAERILAGFPQSPHAARARRVAEEAKR